MNAPSRGRRLRVLHLIETLGRGGAEVLLANTLPRLNALVDVRVAALAPPDTLSEELSAAGVHVHRLGELSTNDLAPVALARALGRNLRAEPVDILHTHLFKATLVGRLARMALRGGPKVVTTLHNPDSHSEAPSMVHTLARRIVDWGSAVAVNDALVAVSKAVADDFHRHYGTLGAWGRIEVIHNALDVDRYSRAADAVNRQLARQRWGWAVDEYALFSVGRLTVQKNYDALVDAVTRLRTSGLKARAVVIGDGPERTRLEARSTDWVRFHGPATPDEIVEGLVGCDVYVQPSRWEAFGMAVLEAMAVGRPVVAMAVDGVREVVAEGETAVLVPPSDDGALAAALRDLASTPERARAFGAVGRERARRLFSLDTWVAKTVALYSRLADRA